MLLATDCATLALQEAVRHLQEARPNLAALAMQVGPGKTARSAQSVPVANIKRKEVGLFFLLLHPTLFC